ncbi:MAG: sensor histidine kinase [Prevotella sp.]
MRYINSLIFTGLGLFSYYLIVNFTDFPPEVREILYSRGALIYTAIAFTLLGFVTIHISEWVNSRYMQKTAGQWHFTAANFLVASLVLALNYGLCVIAKALADISPAWSFSASGWRVLMVVWMAEMTIILLLLSNRTLKANQRLKQEAARLQIENSKARYDALQSQLNPHFLFNSLNTLIAEIKYNPDNAVCFTRHLSNVYRYVLQCHNRQLVTISEELAFVKSFVFLHKVRLGDCLLCDIYVPDEFLECELPPLTLQLLVENVIKHNSISQSKPMVITIKASGESLTVSNRVSPKKNSGGTSSGIGLRNLATRCRLVCDRDITIKRDNNIFSVTIPVII